mmetsp:Transcript_89048/g.157739  ORF Transcript_89048/g.157739 Transcript_89048/m.157739 type:complete len:293 (+) Transcript_89048:110-988(+)|eukprot:CAMPEP_0197650598 /NCGR_PEP_ID=MMETSP1338-20131121/31042_1 /TAXON_ID=43686 ORGANISM="Pelagodinium beii, Strain RCC1491" /NCGR_SAMPLE_ID=MMETSP1338 /ASSEMBLY_ACC=CAM_ASM_000754 /LENGTH=292 /DNA_ID=CAMNT_0043225035 /DNA_START=107 /DNA_END=985 /DNA_ORIENTATION=+
MHKGLVASKACAKRVREREHAMHKQRIQAMKPEIDTMPPETLGLDHLRNNLKREQMLEERYHEIDRDNRILLQKMSDIMKHPSVKSGAGGQNAGASMTRTARKADLQRITQENHAILRRIQQAQPVYNHVHWEEDYKRSYQYVKNACEYPPSLARGRSGKSASTSSLTPMPAGKAKLAATTGSAKVFAPGESGYEGNPKDDLRYVLKEGKSLNGQYFLVEMATDGRSLAITAYEAQQQKTLELLVSERNHRKLYRDHKGDYAAIAAKLKLAGDELFLDADAASPTDSLRQTM